MSIISTECVADALDYAARGWRVVILHGIHCGRCTCGKGADCPSPGKHPRLRHWQVGATADAGEIRDLYARWPDSNVGIRLGPSSGVIDVEHDSPEGARSADRMLGGIQTPTYRSARSVHRLYRFPEGLKIPAAVIKRHGLELRLGSDARGAQSVFPPSIHASGVRYAWLPGLSPMEVQLADMPPCLVELLTAPQPSASSIFRMADEPSIVDRASKYIATMPSAISGQGGHDATFAVACELYRFGVTDEQAHDLLSEYNDRCEPPWTVKDLGHKLADAKARVIAAGEYGCRVSPAAVENGKPQHPQPTARIRSMPRQTTAVVLRCDTVEPRDVSWLWPGRVPLGRITLLVGRPGEGKSFVTLDMAARVSTGTPWPDGSDCRRGSVVIMSAEDDPADTIVPRLIAHHADRSRVHLLTGLRVAEPDGSQSDQLITLAHVDVIEQALASIDDCRLIVIDPIGSYLGGKTDAHRDNEVRSVLAPIAQLAERHGVAVVIVAHRRKAVGQGADESALGSRAFTGIARVTWHLSRDPQAKSRRLLLPGKNNLAAEGTGLAFTIVDDPPRVSWERDPVQLSADDGLAAELQAHRPGPEAQAQGEAETWLRSALSGGPRPARDLYDEWQHGQCGSRRTLERAKARLGVRAHQPAIPGPWVWELSQAATSPKGAQPGDLGGLGKNPGKTHDSDPPDPQAAKLLEPGGLGPGGLNGEWIP